MKIARYGALFLAVCAALSAKEVKTMKQTFLWEAGPVLVGPPSGKEPSTIAIKDPSIVEFEGRWHLFATTADKKGSWGMAYLNFKDWSLASKAKAVHLDRLPAFAGYHCAPQVFYFRPQKKWYLIYQSGQPQFSTADRIDEPGAWTKPVDFFDGVPTSVVDKAWLDFWIICDQKHAYLFFTGDNGLFYRSRTALKNFPRGFSKPVVCMRAKKEDLYEAGATYFLKGKNQYLTLIEAMHSDGSRYYRSFLADTLDGEWKPLAASWEDPFAGSSNVVLAKGVKPWTKDISHGELLREGYDETMTVDPAKMRLLFQGRAASSDGMAYSQLPYRLGILTLKRNKLSGL